MAFLVEDARSGFPLASVIIACAITTTPIGAVIGYPRPTREQDPSSTNDACHRVATGENDPLGPNDTYPWDFAGAPWL